MPDWMAVTVPVAITRPGSATCTVGNAAAALPTVQVADPGRVIATGTVTAIQSGIYYGYVGMIEGIITRMKAEYGEKLLVIATGGLAPLFEKATPMIDRVERDLIMFGLLTIYKMNR